GLGGVVAVAGGDHYSLALHSDGTLSAWGNNASGQLGDATGTTSDSRWVVKGVDGVVDVRAGAAHTVALRGDGTVWTWGDNAFGQLGDGGGGMPSRAVPQPVPNLSSVSSVGAGARHAFAVGAKGTVWTWGRNSHGQLGLGDNANRTEPLRVRELTDVTVVSGGADFSLAMKRDGTVLSWGSSLHGALGLGTAGQRSSPGQVALP
ncbi:chromosome condensation regulator RCC1, partial [Myxococcus sp. AM001]|nr:chromosome condensation regulator RCC1 [Myxococcus sp. AM001]